MRVGIIVTLVPAAITWCGVASVPDLVVRGSNFDPAGLTGLLVMAVIAALLAAKVRLPNAWLLGPMTLSAAITGLGFTLSTIPPLLIAVSQVLLGTSLGAMFSRDTLRGARGFFTATMVGNALLLSACLGLGIVGMLVVDAPLASMILATAPGGVTEVSITAKALHLDVALVSAFHVVRIFMIVPTTPLVFQGLHRFGVRLQAKRT